MTHPHSSSRSAEVWLRFVGLFGGEQVRRRFGDSPPAEWTSIIGRLSDFELDRGMRRVVFSGKAAMPSLPEFVKLCRTIGDAEGQDDGPANASPDRALEQTSRSAGWPGDEWDIAGNQRLLAHVTRCGRRLAPDSTYDAGMHQVRPEPLSERIAAILVSFKKTWAEDMRTDRPNLEQQSQAWDDCMAQADLEIEKLMASVRC